MMRESGLGDATATEAQSCEPVGAAKSPSPQASLEEACSRIATDAGLSARERELLGYLARGHRPPYAAEQLCISENTVRTHMRNMYRKLGVSSGEELIQLVERTLQQG